MSKEAKEQALRDIELDYWRTLGNEENAFIDIGAVERILSEIDKTKVEIRFLKADAQRAEIGTFKKQSATDSVVRSQAKLRTLQNQLNTIEREATQL
ncbi:MAG: hypothetical protein ACK55I_32170, partial [bacterium]